MAWTPLPRSSLRSHTWSRLQFLRYGFGAYSTLPVFACYYVLNLMTSFRRQYRHGLLAQLQGSSANGYACVRPLLFTCVLPPAVIKVRLPLLSEDAL